MCTYAYEVLFSTLVSTSSYIRRRNSAATPGTMLSSEPVVGSLAAIGLTVAVSLGTQMIQKKHTKALQEELTRAEAALTILNEAEQAVAQQKAELQAIRESQDFAQIIKERDEAKASVIRLEKETETIAGFLADTKQELQKLHADKHVVDQLLQATHLDNDEKAQSLLKMTEAVDSAEQSYNQTVQDELERLFESISGGAGKEAVTAMLNAHDNFLGENRRILQERFDQARQAKAEVVDALNAENVPAEEQQVLEKRKILLDQKLTEVAQERTEFENKAERLLGSPL